MQFSDKLRVMRAVRNMSQMRLTLESGVCAQYVSRAEKGLRPLTKDEQLKVRIALSWPEDLDKHIEALVNGGFIQ